MSKKATMDPGDFDREITLHRRGCKVGSDGGLLDDKGLDGVQSAYGFGWASREDRMGVERDLTGGERVVQRALFRMHWRDDIDGTTRIVEDGVSYDVIFPKEVGRRAYLEVLCKRVD